MITKEQFERFNKHFTVREAVTINADFDLITSFDEIESAIQNFESNKFFDNSTWNETYSETASSDGYAIYNKTSDSFIQSVSNLDDIIEFIEDTMNKYIPDLENND